MYDANVKSSYARKLQASDTDFRMLKFHIESKTRNCKLIQLVFTDQKAVSLS
jgi:hypothetical protein